MDIYCTRTKKTRLVLDNLISSTCMCDECSICLNPVRHTRSSKQLECGHLYHRSCVDQWISAGGDTCPVCRNQMRDVVPKYRVTVRIENTETSNIVIDEILSEFIAETFQGEINFETDTSEELNEILRSLGFIRGVDIDSLIFNAEGTAVL